MDGVRLQNCPDSREPHCTLLLATVCSLHDISNEEEHWRLYRVICLLDSSIGFCAFSPEWYLLNLQVILIQCGCCWNVVPGLMLKLVVGSILMSMPNKEVTLKSCSCCRCMRRIMKCRNGYFELIIVHPCSFGGNLV